MTIKLSAEEINAAIKAHLAEKGIAAPPEADVVFYVNEGHGHHVGVRVDHAEVYLK